MNILMVYPKYPNTFWSFKHILRFISKKAAFLPPDLLTIASMLPKNWNKWLIDLNVGKLTDSDLHCNTKNCACLKIKENHPLLYIICKYNFRYYNKNR